METHEQADPGSSRELRLAFTASGSEYFRIWIVNLLLIAVSLGFYMPFAKARRLRYFYANTRVDDQPLAFHGDPWKMFRGYLVMLVIFGAYAAAAQMSDWATLIAFSVLAAIWPALWRSSLMFRLSNTSWRGLRFGFDGSLSGAYRAMLPLFVPGLLILLGTAWAMSGVDRTDEKAMAEASLRGLPLTALGLLIGALALPWLLWLMRRYQHSGYRYAQEQSGFTAGPGAFYRLGLKMLGVGVIGLLLLLAVLGLLMFGVGMKGQGTAVLVGLMAGLGYLLILAVVGAFSVAWLQNLSWSATQSRSLRFSSRLSPMALARVNLSNLFLTIVTLGLYRPFAVVKATRLRLEAMSVSFSGDVDAWQAGPAAAVGSGSGEMSGDFFGIDVGL